MPQIDQTDINSVASSHGIPPSILQACVDSSSGTMGMGGGTASGFGFSTQELDSDPNLALEIAARALQQSFSQYGNWEQALSYYSTGDANAYQNPNSSVGGFVAATLGQAALNPMSGMSGLNSDQTSSMYSGLSSLSQYMGTLVGTGGAISSQNARSFSDSVTQIGNGYSSNGPGKGQFSSDRYPWGQCIAIGTPVETSDGAIPIEDIKAGDLVCTREGLRPVTWSGLTRKSAQVLRIETGDGEIVCTPDHRLWSASKPLTLSDTSTDVAFSSIRTLLNKMTFGASALGTSPYNLSLVGNPDSVDLFSASNAHPWVKSLGQSQHLVAPIDTPSRVGLSVGLVGLSTMDVSNTNNARKSMNNVLVSHVDTGQDSQSTSGLGITPPATFTFKDSSGPSDLGFTSHGTHYDKPQWRYAQDIKSGDRLWKFCGSEFVPVVVHRVTVAPEVDVYDLTVEGVHEFIAAGFLVHNCTWFVAGVRPDLNAAGNFGNANEWLKSAKQKGISTTNTPSIGAVAVYGAGNGYDAQDGHVGIVTAINSDGTFQVTSDHWGGLGETHVGTSTMTDVEGFIPAPPAQAQQIAQQSLDLAGDPNKQQVVIPKSLAQSSQAGASGAQAAKTKSSNAQTPDPKAVNEFAQQLKGLGIDISHFNQYYQFASQMFRKLSGNGLTLDKYAPMAQQGMGQNEIMQFISNLPHNVYPNITLGQFSDAYNAASLHSVSNTNPPRTPYPAEAARFASSGAKASDMATYYQQVGSQPAQMSRGMRWS